MQGKMKHRQSIIIFCHHRKNVRRRSYRRRKNVRRRNLNLVYRNVTEPIVFVF